MVWRQQQVGEDWVTIDKARTDRKGRVTFATKKPWPPGQVTAERLLVVRKGQPIGLSDQMSVTVVPSVAPRTVVLKTPAAIEVRAGKPVTITARIRPRAEGVLIVRQAFSGDQWVAVDKARTDAQGRVTFTIKKAKPAGAVYMYRLVAVERRQAAGASPDIVVTVR
jgi:5-hydroxyisourate hydrolase-like protein (transthyretin family)